MYDVHTVEMIVLSSATRNMATKAETIRQITLRGDWFSGGPGGPGGPPALAGPWYLTPASVVVSLCWFINSGAPIVADLVLSDMEVYGGGMVIVVFVAPLTKMRSIGYQGTRHNIPDQNEYIMRKPPTFKGAQRENFGGRIRIL